MKRRNIAHLPNFVSVDALTDDMIMALINRAFAYKAGATYHFLEPKIVANVFMQESFRIRNSFEIAQIKLGIKRLDIDANLSIVDRDERIYHQVRTLNGLGVHGVVIRTEDDMLFEDLLKCSDLTCALINAGNGQTQSPAQCMVDLMTIYEVFKRFTGIQVGIVGNIEHPVAQTAKSALERLGAIVRYVTVSDVAEVDCISNCVNEIVRESDVIMSVPYDEKNGALSKSEYFQLYGITFERFQLLKKHAIILHPGPIHYNCEIDERIMDQKNTKIMLQTQNSVYMNMAILESVLVI